MTPANQCSLTGRPCLTPQENNRWPWQIGAGGLLVGLSTHLGFPLPLGVGHKHAIFGEGCVVGTFVRLDENVWPVRPFGGERR